MKLAGPALLASALGFSQSLSLHVREPVAAVNFAGHAVIAYELDIANKGTSPVELRKVQITGEAGAALLTYDRAALAKNALLIAPKRGKLDRLNPGSRAVVFVWVEAGGPVHWLTNQVFVSGVESPLTVVSTVASESARVLGTPLDPGDWWIANGPSNTSDHRRAQVRKDGDLNAPFAQRYAIDFGLICDGRWFQNKGKANSDYCGWGSKVLAVAAGQVVSTHDGVPENSPGSLAVKLDKQTLMGNHVILDIGGGHWALYAHLKPGSLLVKAGDRVEAGQAIGRVGNTGSSGAPHLHFHLSKAGSPEDVMTAQTDPVPYVFANFARIGAYGTSGFASAAPERQERCLPAAGAVIRFE
ncbi:MAG: M23 family metallopeptidase [Bryobacteraceae bacterium]